MQDLTQQVPGEEDLAYHSAVRVRAIRAVVQTVTVFAGWDAGAVRAAEPIALLLWKVVQGAAE